MKNNKGITLIALVVTIIVLLILAGVSIAMLSGDNGILTNAQKARDNSASGALEEATKIAVGNIMTENLGWPYSEKDSSDTLVLSSAAGTDGADAKTAITSEIEKINSNIKVVAGKTSVDTSTKKLTITATVDEKEQTVKVDLLTGAVTK